MPLVCWNVDTHASSFASGVTPTNHMFAPQIYGIYPQAFYFSFMLTSSRRWERDKDVIY